MKRIGITILAGGMLFPVLAAAQTSKAPVPSDALKLKFFKAQSEMIQAGDAAKQANQEAQQTQVKFQGVVKELTDFCGKDFQPQLDPKTKDPVCLAKPDAAKEVKK